MSKMESKVWGKGEFANMPSDVVNKEYPKSKSARTGDLDDTITGIDGTVSRSEGKVSSHVSNQH